MYVYVLFRYFYILYTFYIVHIDKLFEAAYATGDRSCAKPNKLILH